MTPFEQANAAYSEWRVMLPPMPTATRVKIDRLDKRINKLVTEREGLIRELAQEQGFIPCGDCFNGYCSMNCSSAPGFMKVFY